MVVVLPAPFGPSRPKHSPRATSRSSPSTAVHVAVALDQPFAADGERMRHGGKLTKWRPEGYQPTSRGSSPAAMARSGSCRPVPSRSCSGSNVGKVVQVEKPLFRIGSHESTTWS